MKFVRWWKFESVICHFLFTSVADFKDCAKTLWRFIAWRGLQQIWVFREIYIGLIWIWMKHIHVWYFINGSVGVFIGSMNHDPAWKYLNILKNAQLSNCPSYTAVQFNRSSGDACTNKVTYGSLSFRKIIFAGWFIIHHYQLKPLAFT